jgi:hypothetical protein
MARGLVRRSLIGALLVAAVAAVRPAAAQVPAALEGCWQDAQAPDRLVRLFARTWMRAEGGRVREVCRITRAEGAVLELRTWDFERPRVEATHQGEALVIRDPRHGAASAWRKLERVPPALELRPLALPDPEGLPSDRVSRIGSELVFRASRTGEEEERERAGAWLRGLVLEVGWIDGSRFNGNACKAAIDIAMTAADMELLLAVEPILERRRDGNHPMVHDAVALLIGGKQRFGWYYRVMPDGSRAALPVENPAWLEAYWKDQGFDYVRSYLKVPDGGRPTYLPFDE